VYRIDHESKPKIQIVFDRGRLLKHMQRLLKRYIQFKSINNLEPGKIVEDSGDEIFGFEFYFWNLNAQQKELHHHWKRHYYQLEYQRSESSTRIIFRLFA
jgi:hypothetical protein